MAANFAKLPELLRKPCTIHVSLGRARVTLRLLYATAPHGTKISVWLRLGGGGPCSDLAIARGLTLPTSILISADELIE